MLARIKPRLTYANVVSTIALFVVLGGGAYATHTHKVGPKDIKKNAVKKKQLAPRAVNPPHIAQGAVRTRKIFDGAVTASKLAPGVAVSGPQGEPGSQGPKGDQGDLGPQGPAGATNIRARFTDAAIPANNTIDGITTCDPGEQVVSGGWTVFNILPGDVHDFGGRPDPGFTQGAVPTQWRHSVLNSSATTGGILRVYALCASP